MKTFCALALAALVFVSNVQAQKPAEYTSRTEVAADAALKRDFAVQGEYVAKSGELAFGVNVIAQGKGEFKIVVFVGGLPGDGWKRGDTRIFCSAKWRDDKNLDVLVEEVQDEKGRRKIDKKPDGSEQRVAVRVEPGKLIAISPGDGKENPATKIERKSPTEDLKAPEGALVLYADGKRNEEMWTLAKLNEQAQTLWAEAATRPFEKKPYTLHVEFMTSYMPDARGQKRANSGVYIDEAYECQVLDSFGLEGMNNECGGFYKLAEPAVNMCFPPLQWQTYDIDFTPAAFDADGKKTAGAKISVKHNGVVIHDGIEPEKETPGRKKEGPDARGLYLQGHGNKVQYRNIWVKYTD